MSDLINRSDAIRALHKYFSSGFDCDRWWNSTTVLFALNNVPSANIPQENSVSRRYLLAEIDDLADEFSEVDEKGLHSERWCGILDSKWVILNAPSVSDRLQGEWIKNSEWWGVYKCSLCRKTVGESMNYCPHCGAKMKEADNE